MIVQVFNGYSVNPPPYTSLLLLVGGGGSKCSWDKVQQKTLKVKSAKLKEFDSIFTHQIS